MIESHNNTEEIQMGFKKFVAGAADFDSAWVDCTEEENAAIIAAIIETTPTA